MRRLERAGLDVQQQTFSFKSFEELAPAAFARISPSPAAYADPDEFAIMSYSGSGDVTGRADAGRPRAAAGRRGQQLDLGL